MTIVVRSRSRSRSRYRSRSRTGRRSDEGSVTAEFAVALPAVILVLVMCLGALQLMSQQIRVQDAASVAARTVARGTGEVSAAGIVAALTPGASVQVETLADLVCVTVRSRGASVMFSAVAVEARSCSPSSDP